MNITIKSKKYGTHTFWMSSNGGAVCYGEDSLGAQICERGGFTGKTISCNPDYFRAVCYEWLRARAKNSADNQS